MKLRLAGILQRNFHKLVYLFILPALLLAPILPGADVQAWQAGTTSLAFQVQAQTATPDPFSLAAEKAQNSLAGLTPEERIGQLFLVTFQGQDAGSSSDIADLISNYFIGGVVLSAANDNFSDGENTVENAISLTRQLQMLRQQASQESRTNSATNESFTPAYIPLFIGISQEGDGYPYDQVLQGVTQLPNQMAIGATWQPELARQVGNTLGTEMAALGVNLLLGPSLDVLESPHTESASDLGTRTFGGDPYWVSKLGQAYIEGLHAGGGGRLAVIAKHFPGYGGSDRLPEEEVATVRKSLDQLLSFELLPFINVTGQSPSAEATADGLLSAHIRYQGFQGNIRATTRPVSFDPQALKLLLSLPDFEAWRSVGGIMVSDNLGSRAVRGFYDLTSQTFDMPRRVALNAFLAGNDLLYVGDFTSAELDSITSAKRTLEFFAQKYREDPAFAGRVDESVLRILTLKYRLYDEFNVDNVLAPSEPDSTIGDASQVTFDVARLSATLLSPTQAELDETIPDPPNQNDRIVFITDTRLGQQCSQCASEPLVAERALEQAVLRLYGPQAGGQVTPANLISYSMKDLLEMLDKPSGAVPIERSLFRANWIVFSMLDASLREPSYQVLSQFLTERPDLFQNKRLIVFALNAPYFLDATNISKLTAYFGLYSKVSQFVDMAAYLLFQELSPEGASPVSIPGISYELNNALLPDPIQVIPLELDIEPLPSTAAGTPEPIPAPIFKIGDTIPIRTGMIVDSNGNPVPDGTPVEFYIYAAGQNSPSRQLHITSNGVSKTAYTVASNGILEIQAISDPAESEVLTFDIPAPGEEEQVTPSATATIAPTPTPTETAAAVVSETTAQEPVRPTLGDWIMALLLASGTAWLAYKITSNASTLHWGIRTGLLVLCGGLTGYCYLVLHLPGSEILLNRSLPQAIFLATIAGTLVGLGVAWLWQATQKPSADRSG